MSYEWKPKECGANGIPYVKGPRVRLEKDGVTRKFVTQEEVDWAWKNGWYDVGRPETADEVVEAPKWPDKEAVEEMGIDEIKTFIEDRNIPCYDKRLGLAGLRKFVIDFIDYPE